MYWDANGPTEIRLTAPGIGFTAAQREFLFNAHVTQILVNSGLETVAAFHKQLPTSPFSAHRACHRVPISVRAEIFAGNSFCADVWKSLRDFPFHLCKKADRSAFPLRRFTTGRRRTIRKKRKVYQWSLLFDRQLVGVRFYWGLFTRAFASGVYSKWKPSRMVLQLSTAYLTLSRNFSSSLMKSTRQKQIIKPWD